VKEMNSTTKAAMLVLLGLTVLLAAGALMAAADPSDTTHEPTEDWVFDEGKTTTIKDKVWTMEYSITVMNGSKLILDGCTWIFNGNDPINPIFIYTEQNSTLEVKNCEFNGADGGKGYYIEAHDTIKIVNTKFAGMVLNPTADGCIACYECDVTVEFVEFSKNREGNGLYTHNCALAVANSKFSEVKQDAIYIFVGDNGFNVSYNATIQDTEIFNTTDDGVTLAAYTNYGNAYLKMFNVKVHDTKSSGIVIDVGDHSTGDNGNGSVFVELEGVAIYNIADMALYTSSLYQVVGVSGQNMYNVSLLNSTVTNVTNTGIYVQILQSAANYNLRIYNTKFTDISIKPAFDRIGAVWWWYQYNSGSGTLNVTKSNFTHCNPAAFFGWDYGSCTMMFQDSDFTQNIQDAIFDQVKSGGQQSPIYVENCTFHDNEGYGIRSDVEYQWSGSCVPIVVTNSTFLRNGNSALAVTSQSYDYSSNSGFNVTNCLIAHHQNLAVSVNPDGPQGAVVLHMVNCTVFDTAGIFVGCSQAYGWQSTPFVDALFINTTIENSTSTALSVKAMSQYYGIKGGLVFYNSTIRKAGGEGIRFVVGQMYDYSWATGGVEGFLDIRNSTIEGCGGIALSMTSTSITSKGDRDFYIANTTFYDAQRGVFSVGFGGEMWYGEVKGMLKEDIYIIGAKANLYYVKFSLIADTKFKAVEGGELYFIYDLTILVKWDTGAPAVGANVQIMDNTEKLISVLTVPSSGRLDTFTMYPYFARETGLFSTTPYVINVSFLQVTKTVGVKLDYNKVVEIILEDHFEPEIYILRPKEGHVQQSTTLQVYGSAWDAQSGVKSVLISLDGVNWFAATGKLSWRYTFEVNDTLIGRFSGMFNLRAKAVDYANNERLAFVLIRIDPTPPQLTVDYPYDGYVTNNPDMWVRGVTEIGSRVEINSVPVDLVVSMFTHKVTLVEGPNTISVISIDMLGNINIVRMTVYLDTQVPYLILISPTEEGATTNLASILVNAQLEEGLDVSINGRPIPYGSDAYPRGTGELRYDLALEPGENVLVIQARDTADNLLLIERIVTFDTTPPWIQVISPTEGALLAKPEVTIIGTVEPTAMLLIADEDVTVQNGYFERTILCLEGRNDILLSATDLAGNVYNETVVVFVDTEDPAIKITAPSLGTVIVKEKRFFINGTCAVKLTDGTTKVTASRILLNGLPYTLIDDGTGQLMRQPISIAENGTFSIPVDLLEGKNDYTVEVQDAVGNGATASRAIRLDTRAPTLVVYIDPLVREKGKLTSPASTVNITGYTDPGSVLTVKGILLPVADDGTFIMPFVLNPRSVSTEIVIDSVDPAGNVREIRQNITYMPLGTDTQKETNWGLWFLVISLVILVVVGIVSAYVVRSRRDEWLEMEAARTTPVAPIEPLEPVKGPETLPGPEEIGMKEEGKGGKPPEGPATSSATAVRPRPRPPQARRAPPARPAPKAPGAPEGDAKDLSDQGAEAESKAEETDQEGM
jgi:hypothetical protein